MSDLKPDQFRYTHFAECCRERGPFNVDPFWLADQLERAATDQPHALDFAEHVIPCHDSPATIWRFRINGAIYYAAIGPTGRPRTILTKRMVSRKKWALKKARRGQLKNLKQKTR